MDDQDNSWMETERLDSFDSTLANLGEVVFATLDAAGARSVAEVGAEHGLFTERLLAWAAPHAAHISAIDPAPRERLVGLAEAEPSLELIVGTSQDVLPRLDLPDAVVIDGDHNYYTVSEELRLIAERASNSGLPLLLLHDVGWPLGRRDSYADPERIPEEHRQPVARDAFLVPGDAGVADRGLYYECTAATEGGARNGVLTAVEDFLAGSTGLRMAFVAPFFGLGVVWPVDAPWAAEVERTLAPWDRNPVLERVEAKRIEHLVAEFVNLQRVDALRTGDYELRWDTIGRLLPIYGSRSFAVAEHLSRLRQAGTPNFSREALGRLLQDLARDDIRLEEMGYPGPVTRTAANGKPAAEAGPDVVSDSA